MKSDTPKYHSRNLRIHSDAYAGHTVEHGDLIVAGPYASKDDAKQAKADLIAGRPLHQLSDGRFHPDAGKTPLI